MSRYINADALTKEIKQDIADDGLTERYVFYRINETPSIDIVKCEECKKHGKNSCPMTFTYAVITDNNNYCSYAERRTDEKDNM